MMASEGEWVIGKQSGVGAIRSARGRKMHVIFKVMYIRWWVERRFLSFLLVQD